MVGPSEDGTAGGEDRSFVIASATVAPPPLCVGRGSTGFGSSREAMDCAAVIVAAGRGERLGGPTRKALVPLGGRPMLAHSLETFAGCPSIRQIVLVVHAGDLESASNGELGQVLEPFRPVTVVPGGARRQDSVRCGVEAVRAEIGGVLVHDAARPFVGAELIERLSRGLDTFEAALPVVPVTSTVKRVTSDGLVDRTVPRETLRLAQTPQAVRRDFLLTALRWADRDGEEVTDEAQAVERARGRVICVDDSPRNFKITNAFDLEIARLMLGVREVSE